MLSKTPKALLSDFDRFILEHGDSYWCPEGEFCFVFPEGLTVSFDPWTFRLYYRTACCGQKVYKSSFTDRGDYKCDGCRRDVRWLLTPLVEMNAIWPPDLPSFEEGLREWFEPLVGSLENWLLASESVVFLGEILETIVDCR